jgi:G:T/U-mismatch repair DNA glycosylase
LENRPIEILPIPPYVEGNPTKLIIGTFPPHQTRWNFAFFFPNLQNRLWNTLGRVAYGTPDFSTRNNGFDETAIEERQAILRELNAAMVNIVHTCSRKGKSALDNDLYVVTLHPIVTEILEPHPTILEIFLTSGSGANSCLSLLKRHLKEYRIPFQMTKASKTSREAQIVDPKIGFFELNGRRIEVYSLFSPSPTAQRSGITEAALLRQYQVLVAQHSKA